MPENKKNLVVVYIIKQSVARIWLVFVALENLDSILSRNSLKKKLKGILIGYN